MAVSAILVGAVRSPEFRPDTVLLPESLALQLSPSAAVSVPLSPESFIRFLYLVHFYAIMRCFIVQIYHIVFELSTFF